MKQSMFILALLLLSAATFAQKKPKAKAPDTTHAAAVTPSAPDSIVYVGQFTPGELQGLIDLFMTGVDDLSTQGRKKVLFPYMQRFQPRRVIPRLQSPAPSVPKDPASKDTTSKKQ